MEKEPISKLYVTTVILLMLVLPLASVIIEISADNSNAETILIGGKWFLFWGVGMRLFTAGLRQILKPGFTAKDIFHIDDKASHVIVRELGFANVCMGLTALISIYATQWAMAAAVCGGLYFGIAGIQHIIKKPVSANEWVALVSDLFIFIVMVVFVISLPQ